METKLLVALSALFLTLGIGSLEAQDVSITPFGGYQFGGKLRTREGDLEVPNAANFGATLDVGVGFGRYVHFLYSYQDTELRQREDFGGSERLFPLAVQYFQVGGLQELQAGGVIPFAAFTLGATWLDPKESSRDSVWKFSGTLGLGIRAPVGERIDIRIQGRAYPTYMGGGGSFMCGTGGGCYVGLSGYAVWQGDITGGVSIRL